MNNPTPTPTRKYKRYDEAFKCQAVEQWLLSGKSGRVIAVELGINSQTLHQWKQQFKGLPAKQVAGTLETLQAEKPTRTVARPTAVRASASGGERMGNVVAVGASAG